MLRIEVVYCPASRCCETVALDVPPGATLADALAASGLLERHALQSDAVQCGIWGRHADAATLLQHRDRVEIYRPLTVDPKEARRLRYQAQRKTVSGTPPR